MNSYLPAWRRLTAAARQAPDGANLSAPYGFSTRVAALALSAPPSPSLWQRYSLRALGMAGLLMVGAIAANLGPILHSFQDEADALSDISTELTELS